MQFNNCDLFFSLVANGVVFVLELELILNKNTTMVATQTKMQRILNYWLEIIYQVLKMLKPSDLLSGIYSILLLKLHNGAKLYLNFCTFWGDFFEIALHQRSKHYRKILHSLFFSLSFFTVPKRRLILNLRTIQAKRNIVNGVWKVTIRTSITSIPVWNILENFLKNTSFQLMLKTWGMYFMT